MVECQPSKLNTWVRFPSPAFFAQIAQSVEQRTENPRVTGSIPVLGICHTCASGRVVLCLLAKEKVAGSIPVSRSLRKKRSLIYRLLFFKRISFSIQLSEYETLKEKAENTPMNTFTKKALNAYVGQEIFNV